METELKTITWRSNNSNTTSTVASAENAKLGGVPKDGLVWFVNRYFFYGWVIVGCSTVIRMIKSPAQTNIVTLAVPRMMVEMELSASKISALYASATVAGAFSQPFIGKVADKLGARRMLAIAVGGLALSFFIVSASKFWFVTVFGFWGMRALGVGGLDNVSQATLNRWWSKYRGRVSAFSLVLTQLTTFLLTSRFFSWMILTYGYRPSFFVSGVINAVALGPIALLIRTNATDVGLTPDGPYSVKARAEKASSADDELPRFEPQAGSNVSMTAAPGPAPAPAAAAIVVVEEHWTPSEARRTVIFWLLLCHSFFQTTALSGMVFFMVSIVEEQAVQPIDMPTHVMSPEGLCLAGTLVVGGYIIDRFSHSGKWLLVVSAAFTAAACLQAARITTPVTAVMYGAFKGCAQGLNQSVKSVIWVGLFGGKHLAEIQSYNKSVAILGTALGPLLFGITRDALGTYTWTCISCAALPAAFIFILPFAKRPKKMSNATSYNEFSDDDDGDNDDGNDGDDGGNDDDARGGEHKQQ